MALLSVLSTVLWVSVADDLPFHHEHPHHDHEHNHLGKSHECIHDAIDHELSQHFVSYIAHPAEMDQSKLSNSTLHEQTTRRKLMTTSASYKPIRIRPYYDPLLIHTQSLSADTIEYIKWLVSAAIHYLEQFVQVVPIDGPLFVNRCKRTWRYNNFAFTACPLSDYTQPLGCIGSVAAREHPKRSR